MEATKKMCTLFLNRENGAKSYFRNCPNDPKCLDSKIIGGSYFTESHENKYCFLIPFFDDCKNYLTKLYKIYAG